jgi:hypothetical protein
VVVGAAVVLAVVDEVVDDAVVAGNVERVTSAPRTSTFAFAGTSEVFRPTTA